MEILLIEAPQATLTTRELLILKMIARGYTSKEIAGQLYNSTQTINKHLKNSYKKLGAHNKIEALRKAGLI